MTKVLVVDDSLSVRKVVERALAGRQIEVVSASSGSEAMERIEREEPDVVVCDVVMPDKDGYEICEFVKDHPRLGATPVLLMSGIVNDEVRQRALEAGSADVLSKPFAADDLVRRLERLLAAPAADPEAPTPKAAPHEPEPTPAMPPVATAAPEPAVMAAEIAPKRGKDVAADVLRQFAAIEGVQWAVLADREGFLVDAAGGPGMDAEVAGALSACLAESSDGLGRELGQGGLTGMILEYEKGMVVLYQVGPNALLAIGLTEPAVLGKVRYYAKKALPELVQAT